MNAANIDNQIANARENLRRLIEQATAYSGAGGAGEVTVWCSND
jgi:hypothetical protein